MTSKWFGPRALLLHVTLVGWIGGCAAAAYWLGRRPLLAQKRVAAGAGRDQHVARAHLGEAVDGHAEVVVVVELLPDQSLCLALVGRDEERLGLQAEAQRLRLAVERAGHLAPGEVANEVGGSLVPHGGQNPLEAARLETAVLTGPHTENFTDIFETILAAQGQGRVQSPLQLTALVTTLTCNPIAAARLGSLARQAAEPLGGALDKTVESSETLLASHAHA